ncbi:hypothetical protein MHM93_14725 [Pseudoalteromonas sp. MM17-2]|uniref:hypothetical protein n=1 Tax=Pseudoalteromonas sp. MM17-2 TaxID=2917753 RepID=UPI001EF59E8E|nr:hypothetical protein [Pseudoalteromonas sp. MM17-2]MCG7545433.1 hypothetical protein [Pseudoalteromonas sp. MM17-2]
MSRIKLSSAFGHPSNQSHVTHFYEPTVADLINITEMPVHTEEELATSYLNGLIAKTSADEDSANWTAADRKAALWHLFIETSEDPLISYNYHCHHCGKPHYVDVDLRDLDKDITKQDEIDIHQHQIVIAGRKYEVEFHPLNGGDMERLEQLWPMLEVAKESGEAVRISREQMELQLAYSACVMRFHSKADFKERLELLRTASIKEYAAIAHIQSEVFEEQRHGLHSEYKEGRFYLVSPALPCDEKEGKSTRLLMPFRPNDFIPAI